VLLMAGLCLIAGVAYAPVAIARQLARSQQPTAAKQRTPPPQAVPAQQAAPPHAGKDGYSSDERDFTVGRSVYLRSTKTRIGRIVAADDDHAFPPTFRTTRAKAVQIRHSDGPFDWQPVEFATRVYVVR
jgi:hypothetical protein